MTVQSTAQLSQKALHILTKQASPFAALSKIPVPVLSGLVAYPAVLGAQKMRDTIQGDNYFWKHPDHQRNALLAALGVMGGGFAGRAAGGRLASLFQGLERKGAERAALSIPKLNLGSAHERMQQGHAFFKGLNPGAALESAHESARPALGAGEDLLRQIQDAYPQLRNRGMILGSNLGGIAGYVGGEKTSAARAVAETAAYMTPGLGTGLSLRDAYRSFRGGNWLGGLGHTLLAGTSLIPGGGALGAAFRGARGIGKAVAATRPLQAVGRQVPNISKGLGRLTTGTLDSAARMGGRASKAFDTWKPVTRLNSTKPMRMIAQNPGTTTIGAIGAQTVGDARTAVRQGSMERMSQTFDQLRQNMPVVNPINARPANTPLSGSVFG